MQTWTWWPRGPVTRAQAERLLVQLVDARDWDGLAGLARCLIETLRHGGDGLPAVGLDL